MDFKICKYGKKYTAVASVNGINSMLKLGWYDTKAKAQSALEEYLKGVK